MQARSTFEIILKMASQGYFEALTVE